MDHTMVHITPSGVWISVDLRYWQNPCCLDHADWHNSPFLGKNQSETSLIKAVNRFGENT